MKNSKMKQIVAVFMITAMLLSVYVGTTVMASDEFTEPAVNFVADINCGMSIGNSLDSWPGGNETAWGNPTITKAYITAIKEKGVNAVRIPTTWYKTIGAAPDYKIDPAYLTRVKYVVDYAYSQGMYVILNAHHEGDWLKPIIYQLDGSTPNTEAFNTMIEKYNAMWTQIANKFKDYGEKLIFECHNELRDGSNWNGYDEAYEGINIINQNFVNTIRSTGSNNAKRYIIIKAYAAGAGRQSIDAFTIPNDPAYHMIFSFHSYSPSAFAFPPSTSGSSDKSIFDDDMKINFTLDMNSTLKRLKTKFIDNGIPVICGEMGTVNKDNTAERVKHVTTYVDTVGKYGVKCFWWDNNAFVHSQNSESFGLIERENNTWTYGEVADAMIETANKYVGIVQPTNPTTTVATTTTTEPTTAVEILYGDANSDKQVNALDLLAIKKYIVHLSDKIDKTASDVNFDGNVNALDVLSIKKHIVGIPLKPWE